MNLCVEQLEQLEENEKRVRKGLTIHIYTQTEDTNTTLDIDYFICFLLLVIHTHLYIYHRLVYIETICNEEVLYEGPFKWKENDRRKMLRIRKDGMKGKGNDICNKVMSSFFKQNSLIAAVPYILLSKRNDKR